MKYRIVRNGLGEYAVEQRIFWLVWTPVSGGYTTQKEAEAYIARLKWLADNQRKANTWEVVG